MNEQTLRAMREMVKIQGSDGNWNYDEYMRGMYNGMELMLSIIENREPVYKEAPETAIKAPEPLTWDQMKAVRRHR